MTFVHSIMKRWCKWIWVFFLAANQNTEGWKQLRRKCRARIWVAEKWFGSFDYGPSSAVSRRRRDPLRFDDGSCVPEFPRSANEKKDVALRFSLRCPILFGAECGSMTAWCLDWPTIFAMFEANPHHYCLRHPLCQTHTFWLPFSRLWCIKVKVRDMQGKATFLLALRRLVMWSGLRCGTFITSDHSNNSPKVIWNVNEDSVSGQYCLSKYWWGSRSLR